MKRAGSAQAREVALVDEKMALLSVEIDREKDGRWIADIPGLPGCMTYGATEEEAIAKTKALALRVLADRLELLKTRKESP